MSKKNALLAFIVVSLLFDWGCARPKTAGPPTKVLFIGNSYTSVNDLPSLVKALAEAGGRAMETDAYLPGGYTLEQHAGDAKCLEKIQGMKWDVVILQEQSLTPVFNRPSTRRYARVLHEAIAKQGSSTVFYLTWARQDIPQMQEGADPAESPEYARAMLKLIGQGNAADFDSLCRRNRAGLTAGLNGAYLDIADELNASVAPVGIAWKKALAADPDRALHQPDKSHPNAEGSYLAACVIYATIFDQSPVGLPGKLTSGFTTLVRIAPDDARQLQEIAWQVVQEEKRREAAARRNSGRQERN